MPTYKHYSFDLWLTLIKSNPLYKQQRSRYFYEHFNTQNKPVEAVEHAFRQVDLMCNSINETTGKNIDADELCLMVISLINDNKISLQDIDMALLEQQMENLVFEYLPQIYCDKTPGVLAAIKSDPDNTISILSNTGFIKGVTLRKVLQRLDLDQYFDFQLYSDEAGVSKPNKAFFQLMLNEIDKLKQISLNQIIHIGDNPRADIWGAGNVGINSLLVNANNTSILKLIPDAAQHLFPA